MFRKKSARINTLKQLPNAYEEEQAPRGNWAETHFKNGNPIVLELACGRGEYSIGLAQLYPDKNFIGVDVKGDRLCVGAEEAIQRGLNNVAFLRADIYRIRDYIHAGEVDEIWIIYPDPYRKEKKSNKRLTSERFLRIYRDILKPDALIHLKTDSDRLVEFTLETVKELGLILHDVCLNLHDRPMLEAPLTISTNFEQQHLKKGRTLKYMCFSIDATVSWPEEERVASEEKV